MPARRILEGRSAGAEVREHPEALVWYAWSSQSFLPALLTLSLPLRSCPAAHHMQGFSITLDEAFMRDLCMGRWGMAHVRQATESHCRALHRSIWAVCPRKVGARAWLSAL